MVAISFTNIEKLIFFVTNNFLLVSTIKSFTFSVKIFTEYMNEQFLPS